MTVTKRFYEIDLLRFLAAFCVLMFHYTFRGYTADNLTVLPYLSIAPVTRYGYLGVNLFFLISGFVILMTASSGSARYFVISRVVRLYPAFWVCCTLTFLVMLVAGKQAPTFRQYLINMTMLSGFVGVPSIDAVYWSLFVEIKFYFLIFLALLFGQIHRAKYLLGGWLILYLVTTAWPVKYVSYFLIRDYAPYFIAGAMFYLISKEGLSLYKGIVVAVCYVFVTLHAFAQAGEMEAHYQTSFNAVAVALILAACFLVLFLIAHGRTGSFASAKWAGLGALTYPLYLVHQSIGFTLFNAGYSHVNVHLLVWGVVALMVLVAYIVNKGVEQPSAKPMKELLGRLLAVRIRRATSG